MGIYKEIQNISASILFRYISIIIFLLFFIGKMDVTLGAILGLGVGMVSVYYLNDRRKSTIDTLQRQHEAKADTIKPPPKRFRDREDVVDFMFSIQDFYPYNPLAFEEIVDNIDSFFELYEFVEKGVPNCEEVFALAENKKQNAVNALHSLIFTIPVSIKVTEKHNKAHLKLDEVMKTYLTTMYNKCKRELSKHGYSIERKHIDTGPRPYNHYIKTVGGATYDIH